MPEMSAKRSLDRMPEVFVSDKSITREVSRAVKAGRLRKLSSRLYTRNMADPPEAVVARNLWAIVAGYFPGALIADRTALENAPASDGSVCLVTVSGRDISLPGHTLRPRRGVGPLPTDQPFLGNLFLSSTARAYLENMRLVACTWRACGPHGRPSGDRGTARHPDPPFRRGGRQPAS